jgi:hypothetical protein
MLCCRISTPLSVPSSPLSAHGLHDLPGHASSANDVHGLRTRSSCVPFSTVTLCSPISAGNCTVLHMLCKLQMQKHSRNVRWHLSVLIHNAHCSCDCCKHVGSAKTTVRGKQSTSCDSMYMTTVHTFVGYTMIAPWWYHFGKGPCTGSAAKMQHVPLRHAGI